MVFVTNGCLFELCIMWVYHSLDIATSWVHCTFCSLLFSFSEWSQCPYGGPSRTLASQFLVFMFPLISFIPLSSSIGNPCPSTIIRWRWWFGKHTFRYYLTLKWVHIMLIKKKNKIVPSIRCSAVSDSATPWTVTHQTPLSMEFSRQEQWSELPFPSPW